MKAKKRQFRDKFWKLIKENISEILFELKRTKDTQYFVEK